MSDLVSAYATIIAFVLATLIPLWIPIGVTVAPAIAKRIRKLRGIETVSTSRLSESAGAGRMMDAVANREHE